MRNAYTGLAERSVEMKTDVLCTVTPYSLLKVYHIFSSIIEASHFSENSVHGESSQNLVSVILSFV